MQFREWVTRLQLKASAPNVPDAEYKRRKEREIKRELETHTVMQKSIDNEMTDEVEGEVDSPAAAILEMMMGKSKVEKETAEKK